MQCAETTVALESAALSGDLEAFGHLVDRFVPAFRAIATEIVGDQERANGVIQDARRQAKKAISDKNGPHDINWYDWFSRFVCNVANMHNSAREQQQLAWVKKVMEGDKEAFGLWSESLRYEFLGIAARYVGAQDAESVFQQACARAVHALREQKSRPNKNCAGWFYTIVKNCAFSYRDKRAQRSSRPLLENSSAPLADEVGPLSGVVLAERRRLLTKALNRLPDAERTALELHYFQGLTWGEIADRMSIKTDTARQRGYRAVVKLRKEMGAQSDDG